jgi:hypothetical protein
VIALSRIKYPKSADPLFAALRYSDSEVPKSAAEARDDIFKTQREDLKPMIVVQKDFNDSRQRGG